MLPASPVYLCSRSGGYGTGRQRQEVLENERKSLIEYEWALTFYEITRDYGRRALLKGM